MKPNNLDYISLGNRIKEARKNANLTQADLAEACSLSTSFIGHIERGSRTLSLDSLYQISLVLHVSIDSLVSDSFSTSTELFTSIESSLKYHDKKKIDSFMKTVKILADNIDNL